MELSWRHNLNDYSMPFMINYMSQQATTIQELKKDNEERKAREVKEQKEEDNTPILGGIEIDVDPRRQRLDGHAILSD